MNISSVLGPGTKPGTTMLTRMPSTPTSRASVCAATVTAALVAAYAPWPALMARTASAETTTIALLSCRGQVRHRGAEQLQRAEHVDQPGLLPVVELGAHDRVVGRALGRAADDDVEAAEVLDRTLDQRAALRDVAGVGGHREPACTGLLELAHHLVEVVGSPRRDHDVAALVRQRQRGRAPDAGTDPGDDGDPGRPGISERHDASSDRSPALTRVPR